MSTPVPQKQLGHSASSLYSNRSGHFFGVAIFILGLVIFVAQALMPLSDRCCSLCPSASALSFAFPIRRDLDDLRGTGTPACDVLWTLVTAERVLSLRMGAITLLFTSTIAADCSGGNRPLGHACTGVHADDLQAPRGKSQNLMEPQRQQQHSSAPASRPTAGLRSNTFLARSSDRGHSRCSRESGLLQDGSRNPLAVFQVQRVVP